MKARNNKWLKVYSPPEVDRIWLWVYYNKIPIYPIFYLLKGDCRFARLQVRSALGSHLTKKGQKREVSVTMRSTSDGYGDSRSS